MTSWLNEHIVLRHSLIMVILGSLALSLWNAAYGLSLFFGGAMGVLTFKMLCLDASRVLRLAPGTAQRAARRGYFRRLFFYGAALHQPAAEYAELWVDLCGLTHSEACDLRFACPKEDTQWKVKLSLIY